MEFSGIDNMRLRTFLFWFLGFSVFIIIYKLNAIESDVEKLRFLKETLSLNKQQLQLTEHQLQLIEHLYQNKVGQGLPIIYAITPTYWRHVQKAELTRVSQTLALVPNIHWIVIEDSEERTELVTNLLNDSKVVYTHLNAKTPPFEKLQKKEERWTKHRGIEQRNAGLQWLRDNLELGRDKGIVYFMDDDNTYSVKLFHEISKVKRVGVWPVGLVGGLNAEAPIVSGGVVTGWKTGWRSNREFATDMAGFAINLNLILEKTNAGFSYKMEHGLLESEFLSYFTTKAELEALADGCTKVYVWHTRTETPTVKGTIPYLEV
ncbi:galactosylgalactosylxylosylprotein 3-beta-glucuronosyltransferase I [Atheta coriaria]|uniref:galactosylgalactosylxylosylprotein 3-beta-glucuronosyltransferase I n=1 Tax=Dalotia coriaria TaxID=877792 RepID=UPI0031F4456A